MKFTDNCSILTGAAYQDDVLLVTVMNDGLAEARQQHAIPLLYRHGSWMLAKEEKVLPWLVAGVATAPGRSMKFVIVGWGGQVLVMDDLECHREGIIRKNDHVSIVRSVATINGEVYTAGMSRQVHKRLDGGKWVEIDHGVACRGGPSVVGFEAIDGFSSAEMYAVGLNGEMWNYNGVEWSIIHSPTNMHLHAICCAQNGKAFIGGRAGLFMQGRHSAWDILSFEGNETIWGLKWHGERLYVLADTGVFYVEDGDNYVQMDESGPIKDGDFHTISSAAGKLSIFGRKKIIQHDGTSWSEIDCSLPEDMGDAEVQAFFNNDVLNRGSSYLR